MQHRKPQKVCLCGHARSQHWKEAKNFQSITAEAIYNKFYAPVKGEWGYCGYCYDRCPKFIQDNLRTLEKLSEFAEKKNI